MNNRLLRLSFFLLSIPALAGFFVFYLIPFVRTIWYSMIDNTFQKNFVFIDNYANALKNTYFQLAIKNTFIFSLVGVICIVALSLLLSFGLFRLTERFSFINNLLIAPMILPTASVIFVWQMVFQNDVYKQLVKHATMEGFWTVLPIFLLYIWKNTGINIIIISAAIAGVPKETREAADLDGASGLTQYRHITLPLITPNIMFVVVLSFVNALKSFRESYLFFQTDYPPDAAYTVQYYMNNHFRKLNYPNLTTGSVIFTIMLVIILLVFYQWENKYNDRIH